VYNHLSYRDLGNGRPTLLLHGFAEDGTVWDNQTAALSETCRLILPDLPPATSIEDMAVSIKALLDQLGIDRCTLIGHSMGGYITLAFAALYPERLNALGLFHSTAYPDTEEKRATRRKAIGFIRTNGSAPFIHASAPNLFSGYTREHQPDLIEKAIAKYSTFAPSTLIAWYEAMMARTDRTDVLRQFPRPVLFIIGRDDNVIPLQQSLEQCYLPSISHLHIVENTGHQAMLENPEKSNQLLLEFINFVNRI
jgi:pimeloyl-ACP methyl ester carboxylesterase